MALITSQNFSNSGLPVALDISEQEINFAIRTVEQYIVRPRIGNDLFSDMSQNPSGYHDELDGGDSLGGLKLAEYHLVFGYMLFDKIRLTRYGSAIKDDEHSSDPFASDVLAIAKEHWEIGQYFIEELCRHLNVNNKGKVLPNLVFNELIY